MCGLAAIFQHQPLPEADALIRAITNGLQHRGPDADGHYVDDRVALGHRRLAIIDLSELGRQPMWDVTGRYAVVYNGEIYNYKELKQELANYPFRSGSDTEVLLAGFAAWGVDLFAKLNGIFAFALYDKQEERMWVVRDRFGIKPMYYTSDERFCIVSSEQRPILASGLVEMNISRDAIADFLYDGAVCGVQRCCDDMRQLPAGHYMMLEKGRLPVVKPYYLFFEHIRPLQSVSLDTAQRELRRLLRQAVERQLISDVPLGAFLSGGIDSSAVVAMMSEVSPERPLTFTVGFKEKQFDESPYAALIAKKFNTRHTVLTLEADDFLHELPNMVDALDTPTLDGINTYVVSKMTRKAGVTVALSGLGGDELFAGYATFKRYYEWKQHIFWKLPGFLRRSAGFALQQLGQSTRMRRLGEILSVPAFDIDWVYPQFRGIYDKRTVADMLGHAPAPNPIFTFLHQHRAAIQRLPLLSQYSVAEMTGYTNHMLLKDTDQMSMASALEVRVPFFDNDLVDYVLSLPDSIKFPHTPKSLLVGALGDLLPSEIVHRPKMGFTLPWEQWLRGELHTFCQQRLDALCDRGLLDPTRIRQMWDQFNRQSHQVLASHIWMLVVLEHWLQKNMDKEL
ncbi:MAG: asparagine synthase (glutamine-hydrolyzing) [Bacteroidetes bacterium]|nr:asparagine synthase (glutamine-hydrolyzing) [Bacteroidota bacterium]